MLVPYRTLNEKRKQKSGGTGLVVKREERKREEVKTKEMRGCGRKYCGRVTENKVIISLLARLI